MLRIDGSKVLHDLVVLLLYALRAYKRRTKGRNYHYAARPELDEGKLNTLAA
jgi:hypothetical protein